jgi:Tfp pilus assembly protein FimT
MSNPRDRSAGFGLTSTLVVLAIAGVILAISVGFFRNAADSIQGDADMQTIYGQLKVARETAINQRRSVEVQFTAPNTVTLLRHNIPNGTTVISSAVMEHNAQFLLFAGLPDTPDGFGRATAVDLSGATTVMFTADGMFTDQNGQPVNASIFIGQAGHTLTARAMTVFGATAQIRTYRWNGSAWRD